MNSTRGLSVQKRERVCEGVPARSRKLGESTLAGFGFYDMDVSFQMADTVTTGRVPPHSVALQRPQLTRATAQAMCHCPV